MHRWSVALAGLLCLGMTGTATAQIYSWTDDAGAVHYTADPWSMPAAYRPADLAETPPPEPQPLREAAPPRIPDAAVVQFTPGEPIVVTARLNGVPVSLLLDTGADRTLVSPAAVARAGYGGHVMPGDSSIRILGVTGNAVATQLTVPLLDVAGARIGPVSLIVHDAGLGALDGLLGRDVLDAFTVTIDTANGRATLIPR